ncbi:hypothetical protein N2152v2_002906 [Parachlorella kessleri]
MALLCTPSEAAKCGPGNLSVTFLALLLGRDQFIPELIAAKAPLDARLTHNYGDGPLRAWLAAAQLTDKAVRVQMSKVRSALELALCLHKVDQAKALVSAGASLVPLMPEEYGWPQYTLAAAVPVRDELRLYALALYSGCRLGSTSAALLGQVARLSLLVGQPTTCMAALQAADQHSRQLSAVDVHILVRRAAYAGQVDVTMQVVQHSPGSAWELLQSKRSMPPALAAVLFPYMVERYVGGSLELPRQECLYILVQRALSSGQPAPALAVLRAITEAQQEEQLPLLTPGNLVSLLRTAAAKGCQDVVVHLVQQGADVWSLLQGPPQPVCGFLEECRLISSTVAAVLFPYLVEQYREGQLEVSSQQLAVLVYKAALNHQPDACLAILRLAAARQVFMTQVEASGALTKAARQGQPAVVMEFADQLGSKVLWQLLDPSTPRSVTCQIMQRLVGELEAGVLQLDVNRLRRLMRCAAAHQEAGALVAILHAVREQRLELTYGDVYSVVLEWRCHPDSLELAKLLLSVVPRLDPWEASELAWKAAEADNAAMLELLLGAGARNDDCLFGVVVDSRACTCMAALLRRGPLLAGTACRQPHKAPTTACPVLRLLQVAVGGFGGVEPRHTPSTPQGDEERI